MIFWTFPLGLRLMLPILLTSPEAVFEANPDITTKGGRLCRYAELPDQPPEQTSDNLS